MMDDDDGDDDDDDDNTEILQQMGIYINRCFEMTWMLYYKFVTRLLYTFLSCLYLI